MLLIGCFAHSLALEQALADIERSGIERKHILAVVMNLRSDPDPEAKQSDAIEMGAAWATACAVIGVAAGFGLAWGPIVWGLIGTAAGFGAGFSLHRIWLRGPVRFGSKTNVPEVTVIVQCPAALSHDVRLAMYRRGALSVGESGG
ncbi:hypothetical protein OMP38_05315 [Cohnella ginsengisoli]|uniref:DUF1269 domain-containing protein n=1 Tax=Cohnella ginsengisoli TaxID=425004 RepID=A0A9X4KE32_9BACL|nr:hypothetical protein [Cohnella ginsengisoli]MDG0790333.1 hypothetical protein [Cohnella ginsengisoli]